MIQIRHNVFETNSSMTHSCVMCPTEGYDKWADGKMLFNEYKKPMFMTLEEGRKFNAEVMKKWREQMKNDDFSWDYEEDTLEALTDENIEKYVKGEYDFEAFYLDHYAVEEEMYYSFEYWDSYVCEYYETFAQDYEQNGEKVTAFGYYGHD